MLFTETLTYSTKVITDHSGESFSFNLRPRMVPWVSRIYIEFAKKVHLGSFYCNIEDRTRNVAFTKKHPNVAFEVFLLIYHCVLKV